MKFKTILTIIFMVYTILLVYYSTIAPWRLVEKTAAVMGGSLFAFDPGMSFRHMIAYSLEGLLASAALSPTDAIFVAIPLGMFDESIQAFVPWRTFDLHDLLANVTGSALGVGLYLLLRKRWEI